MCIGKAARGECRRRSGARRGNEVNKMKKNTIRLLALALLLALLPTLAMAMGVRYGVVQGGRLNLRAAPYSGSASLGLYNAGTWVVVDDPRDGVWYAVHTLDGRTGYMMSSYVKMSADSNQATVKYAPGGYVNLRQGAWENAPVLLRVPSGSKVYTYGTTGEWTNVTYNGDYSGFMMTAFLSTGTESATVVSRNGGKVNVRSGPGKNYGSVGSLATGTKLNVLLKGNGWYQISANGMTGFMSTEYISGAGGGGSTVRYAVVNNPKNTQVLNLRNIPSQDGMSIGQYYNGTQVKVVSYGATWCEVYVGTKHGYMMTRYLRFTNGSTGSGNYGSSVVYPAATPNTQYYATPIVQYITPAPTTPPVQYITPAPQTTPAPPAIGQTVKLAIAAGSGLDVIHVYKDSGMSIYQATYLPGKECMLLSYGKDVSMILVDNMPGYVSSGSINY